MNAEERAAAELADLIAEHDAGGERGALVQRDANLGELVYKTRADALAPAPQPVPTHSDLNRWFAESFANFIAVERTALEEAVGKGIGDALFEASRIRAQAC